jgi:hypothetical protein
LTLEIIELKQIKIVSGWSDPGGSTVHFIELCNLLNNNGLDCTFYGPHNWHLDKCKSGTLDDASLVKDDILISHFINIKVPVEKHILSCHETNIFPLKEKDLQSYDIIHFVSNPQKKWHSVNHPSIIIPPVVNKIKWKDPDNNVAGVIGNIDNHKQVHLSIKRAIEDGFNKVLLFGNNNDPEYYNQGIMPWVSRHNVVPCGHEDDREKMYSQISAVYHSSKRETYGLVEAECKLAGIPFNGPKNNQEVLEKEEILDRWKKVLQ